MNTFFILLVFSFIAIAMSDQDSQHAQLDSEFSSTEIDTGPFQYQQFSSNLNTAKKDSLSSYQTYTVKPKPLIEFANSQQSTADKSKSFSSQYDDMMLVYPDNPVLKQATNIEHHDILQTSTIQNPDQINNLQSIDSEKPAVKPKPLIELINDMQSIVTKQQDEKIKPLISSIPFGSTNVPDIEVLNASQAINFENSTSKPKPISEFLSTSQSTSSQPVILADRFTESSNTPQPIDNESPVVISTPLSEFFSNQQPNFSNPFDLSDNPSAENDNTPQLIDTVHPIVKKILPAESEKFGLEPVKISQTIIDSKSVSAPNTPINHLLEHPLKSVPQHLPYEAEALRGLLGDLNSLGLLEKPIAIIEIDEPLLLSSPSSWPSGINAVVQQAQNQIPPFSLVYPDPDLELSRRISHLKWPIFKEPYLPVINEFRLVPVTVPEINPTFNPRDLLVPTVGHQNNGYPQYPVYPTVPEINPPFNPWDLLVPTVGHQNNGYPQYPVYPTVPDINPPFNPWDLLVPTIGYQNNGYPQYPVYPTVPEMNPPFNPWDLLVPTVGHQNNGYPQYPVYPTVPEINPPFNPWDLLVPTVGYQNNGYPKYPVYPTSNIEQFGQYGLSGQGQFTYANGFQDNPFRIPQQTPQFGNYPNRKLTQQQLQELFDSLLLNNYGKPNNTYNLLKKIN